MTVERAYLDCNATAPLLPEAKAAMLAALEAWGNPSSVHAEGRLARNLVESAREKVATLVGARPSEVVFTSGATEANATVLSQPWGTILLSRMEHDSILAAATASKAQLIDLGADARGVARLERLAELAGAISAKPARSMITLQFANNETGVLQPVAEAAEIARANRIHMHCDAVQAVGRIAVDFRALGLDTLSLSGHKIGGPKGTGALVIHEHADITPLVHGGGQERRRRAGTENVAAIAGFGAAAEVALRSLGEIDRQRGLRDRLEREVRALTPTVRFVGTEVGRLANTSCFALPGRLAETLVIRLDLAGVAVSAGAACSSGKVGASAVLAAMGLPDDVARGAIRVSIGSRTTEADIDTFLAAWAAIARDARAAA